MKKLIYTLIFIFCFGFTVQARELESKSNVSVNKIWTINLSYPLDSKSLDNIKVYDSIGNAVQIDKMLTSDSKKITVEPKSGAWGRGIDYTLEIKNIKSIDGKEFKDPVVLKFSTQGKTYKGEGQFATDEQYIYDNLSSVTWSVGTGRIGYKAYQVVVEKNVQDGVLEANLDVDTWGAANIVNSKHDGMKTQIDTVYKYLSEKYPNEKIRVGIWLNEDLNKYPGDLDSKHVKYNEQTGKYHVMMILGGKFETGDYKFITEGN